ncbi:uncharacterized protein DSM5745_04871 [Aspergillus mulundensis]|uniref:Integral membrane protein n=1 Tax=Aspergillus mulundensis TaxID=1810919 RepID=A0A3D8S5M3_9EURO|nr:Uncharacterized protein DSM5745_04871 [Aspergillus mulundensis]RDW81314.1 Uncharacterized protein DSM5745_04871 [Aspergillus mulundensis]
MRLPLTLPLGAVAKKAFSKLKSILKLRASRIFLSSLLLWILLYTHCRNQYWRDPHSAFFQDSHVYDLDYSLHRERESWHFIARYNAASNPPEYTDGRSEAPTVCAAMVTVRREHDTYFEASVGSLLEGLSEKERRALRLTVLFADTDPAVHPSWGMTWVDRLVDQAGGYVVSEEQLEHLRVLERERNFYEKGVFDYLYALRACQEVKAPYTVIFEDDIILATGWFAKTLKSLAEINHLQDQSRGQDQAEKKPWLYLRLFYTETSLGWNDSDAAYRHMPMIFLTLMASTFCVLLLLRRLRFPLLHLHLDTLSIAVLSLLCVPAFTALIYMVGKYNLMPLRGVVEMNKFGCCTQGLLFPADQVDGLITYLEERVHGQTDSLIEEYADLNGLSRYAVAPPVLQHVGLKSSRDNTDLNTQSTWAFWFEANEPGRLRKEHADLLEDEDVREMLGT